MELDRYRTSFDDAEGWESPCEGVRVRTIEKGDARLRLVEMLSSAEHPEWCEVGHGGCVAEGELEIEFESGLVRYGRGEAIFIPPGAAHRHRPRAVSARVRLVLADFAD